MSTLPPPPPPIQAQTPDPPLIPAWGLLRRHRHVTVPLAVAPVFAGAGYGLAASGAREGVTAAAAVAVMAMWLAAPHKWDRASEQWYARLSVIAAAGWLTAATWIGMSLWMLIAVAAGAVCWGVPWWYHKRPRHQKRDGKIIAQWDAWWCHHRLDWNLAGSRITDVTSKGMVETLRVQLWAGRQSHGQVTQVLPLIESALRGYVRHGMIRLEPDPDDPSCVLLHLKRENPLAESITWDASMVPASITQPATLGLGEGGRWIKVVPLVNWFIIGRSRSGKSNELSALLAVITGVPDARAWLIDFKGGRAARPWLPALDWLATTLDEARLMMGALLAEVQARGTWADSDEEQLEPAPEVPAIFLVLDETHEVTSAARGDSGLAALLSAIASMGMGLAVYVIVLTQYGALEESVRSEQTRGSLINRMCFAVSKPEHGAFALNDWQKLDASRLNAKGSFFFQEGPTASSAPGRGPHMPHRLVRQIADANGAMPRQPLRLYAQDHQAVYDSRWSRLPEAFRSRAPQWNDATPPQEAPAEGYGPNPADDAQAAADRIEDECARIPDVPLSQLGPLPTDLELRTDMDRRTARFARALAAAPDDGISPAQLVAASGLARSYIHQLLKVAIRANTASQIARGRYRGDDGETILAAITETRAADKRLLEAASA